LLGFKTHVVRKPELDFFQGGFGTDDGDVVSHVQACVAVADE
jgi:hypothetical protein